MFCENCGASLKDGAKFCPQCGAKIEGDTPSATPESNYAEPANTPPPTANPFAIPKQTPQAGKLYYPDPQRYQRFMGFKEMAAMNLADDTPDFPDD